VIHSSSQRVFFGLLLVGVTIAFLWLIRGFLQPIFWAVAFGIVIFPLHAKIERRLRPRGSLAATASVLLVLLIVILPLAGIGAVVTGEAAALYERIRGGNIDLTSPLLWAETQLPVLIAFLESLGIDPEGLRSQISDSAATVSQFIASQALAIGQNTVRVAVFFFIMLYLLFFFLRDGDRLVNRILRALPLSPAREQKLLERFADVSRATIKGTFATGAVQGMIGGVLFWALGIPAPILWGALMAFLSFLPAFGSAVIWGPAAVMLIVNGEVAKGFILIAAGSLVIGLVDNILWPFLVGRDTRMPDFFVLLATLGGLAMFGVSGFVIGPLLAAFFITFWQMFEMEFHGQPGVEFNAETEQPVLIEK
jgi:predicted PurR-regulated permease PerM